MALNFASLSQEILRTLGPELPKLAGALQGAVRSGRRPISVANLAAKGSKKKVSDIIKMGGIGGVATVLKSKPAKVVATMALGAGGYHAAHRANEDRKMGRQMRLQSGQSF
jgi:hypothetical protein